MLKLKFPLELIKYGNNESLLKTFFKHCAFQQCLLAYTKIFSNYNGKEKVNAPDKSFILKSQEELCVQSHAGASITCEGKFSGNLLSMQELHF